MQQSSPTLSINKFSLNDKSFCDILKIRVANTRLKKAILIVMGSIILTVMIVIALISPIAKYIVEKYVAKYLGRQITVSWIYVNPFTGYVHISNLKIYESKTLSSLTNGDSIFI